MHSHGVIVLQTDQLITPVLLRVAFMYNFDRDCQEKD